MTGAPGPRPPEWGPLPGHRAALRPATAADLPALVELLVDDPLGRHRESTADLAPYRSAFERIDADPAHLLVVAADGPDVVGTLQLSFLPGLARGGALRGQVEAVRVRADRRGQGLGGAMLRWVIEECRRQGATLVQLTSDRSRAEAHRFYAGLGFTASHTGFKLWL
ncbi:GNAT family N-acetyltransferase [Blastococcus xanthinilyticus]|uniref:L-amino acid N-acyltransferase YncA n=1 Tax=Blastococcus xanthinilyticus TaxID=1564164 RepID=A0A5S5D6H7_9ACTN|nr:GNAT family N-acetyltransferase [Blastococcus xanthinilyticus]TYP90382.1 L-amino acid N-acyltransferase YncA [Blastococcus xanthinilyticus]